MLSEVEASPGVGDVLFRTGGFLDKLGMTGETREFLDRLGMTGENLLE